MKRAALVATTIFAIVAFVVGFAGTTVVLDVTRPVVSGSTGAIKITVDDGDTSTTLADKLEKDGLIRNALVFRLLARYKHLDSNLKKGTYSISPGMTMDQIINALQGPPVNEDIPVLVPPGLRVTQYAKYFSVLPKFNADNFNKIAQTGILLDSAKTPLWTKYWFVPKPSNQVKNALEGYLFPDTYSFAKDADETTVVEAMLENLGAHLVGYLCPGPAGSPNAYLNDKAQCKAHAATVGTAKTNVFTSLERAYATTDDTKMVGIVMMLGSLTAREIAKTSDAPGVTNVYYTRWLSLAGINNDFIGGAYNLGSDPSAQYARDSAHPPTDGKWWGDLKGVAGSQIEVADPYNGDVDGHVPPGPIAAPLWAEIQAALTPSVTQKVYFVSDCHGNILYAATDAENNANNNKPCS
jgi:UPF0755 protein